MSLVTDARSTAGFLAGLPGFVRHRTHVAVDAFHLTTLLPSAPRILLNVETDDYGIVDVRACGCVGLIGSDMERILEEDWPSRFGDSLLDYQLIEEEDVRGFTRLTILVHPAVHVTDERLIVEAVLAALSRGGTAAVLSRGVWRQADACRVRREAPRLTPRGKLFALRVGRTSPFAQSGSERNESLTS